MIFVQLCPWGQVAYRPIGVLYPYSPIFVGNAFDIQWDGRVSRWFHNSHCSTVAPSVKSSFG